MGAGVTKADDTLPKRFFEEGANTGPAEGLTSGVQQMLPEYYELRGWTPEGVPSNETLERLKL